MFGKMHQRQEKNIQPLLPPLPRGRGEELSKHALNKTNDEIKHNIAFTEIVNRMLNR